MQEGSNTTTPITTSSDTSTDEVMDRISPDVGLRSPVTLVKLSTPALAPPSRRCRRPGLGGQPSFAGQVPQWQNTTPPELIQLLTAQKKIASIWSFFVLCCFGPSQTVRLSNDIGRHASRRVNCTGGILPKMNEPILRSSTLDPSPSHLCLKKVGGRRR